MNRTWICLFVLLGLCTGTAVMVAVLVTPLATVPALCAWAWLAWEVQRTKGGDE